MPLLYYARQSQLKTKDGVKQWHLTLKKVGRAVSLQQLGEIDRKSTRLNSSHIEESRMPSSA